MKPTGEILPLAKTPFDLRVNKHLGRAIFKLPKEDKGKKFNCLQCFTGKIPEFKAIEDISLYEVSGKFKCSFLI